MVFKGKKKGFDYESLQSPYSLDDDKKLDYFRYLNSPLEATFFAISIAGMMISLWFVFIPASSNEPMSSANMSSIMAIHMWALAFFIVFSIIVAANLVAVFPNREDPKWVEIRRQFKESIKKKSVN